MISHLNGQRNTTELKVKHAVPMPYDHLYSQMLYTHE